MAGRRADLVAVVPDVRCLERHVIPVRARYRHSEGAWGQLEGAYSTHQHFTPPGEDEGKGWIDVRLRLGYDFTLLDADHRILVGADNLFDKEYRNYLTTQRGFMFNEPGRSFFAGYQVNF